MPIYYNNSSYNFYVMAAVALGRKLTVHCTSVHFLGSVVLA